MALGFWRRGKPENGGSAAEARPARVRALLGIALLSIAPAAALASCADEDPLPGKPSGGTGASAADGGPESCSEGAVEECHITVGENNGVLTCLDGMRSCEGGKWGQCEGKLSSHPMPEGSQAPQGAGDYQAPLSLSDAAPCVSNPCDPGCMAFDEVPDGGLTAEAGPLGSFVGGDISTIPSGYYPTGLYEPCNGNEDCQFDHVCEMPVSNSCSHSKCVAGTKLEPGCDSCVDEVCAADSTCCMTPTGTCEHDVCQVGDALDPLCDPCVALVCAPIVGDPFCCQDAYNAPGCAHQPCSVGAALPKTCDPCVATICDPLMGGDADCCIPEFSATCGHNPCTPGSALAGACDPCVAGVCATNPGCCGIASTFSPNCFEPIANKGHSPCQAGKKLPAGCDPCVTAICADPVYSYCCTDNGNAWDSGCINAVTTHCSPKTCNNTWTQACADLVATTPACNGQSCSATWAADCAAKVPTLCGAPCAPGGWTAACVAAVPTTCPGVVCDKWDASCVDKVGSVCGALCEPQNDPDAACAHDPCIEGPMLNAGCSQCVADICAVLPACCSTRWDVACANMVPSVCGVPCVAGDCAPWETGGMDPFCSGADLTLGVPCDNNVPVCNHGATDVPAGVKVFVYPANSPHFPICAPPNDGTKEAECTLTVPVPAGQCVTLNEADCDVADIFSGTHTLMVNPPSSSGNSAEVAECHCENNWSDYHAGTCDTTVIAGYAGQVFMEIYEAVCDPGQSVQWGFLTWNSLTPGGSNIVFQAHAADTVGNLGMPITTLETAKATPAPDTQACALGGPAPDCPVNLFTELGLPEANLPVLELIITMNPSPQGLATPTLNDWEITYSCIDSE